MLIFIWCILNDQQLLLVTVCLSFMAWQKCLSSWYPSFCHFMVLILRIFLSKMWKSNNSGPCFNFMHKLGSFVNSLNKRYWNLFVFPPEINCLISKPSVFSELNPAMGVLVLAYTGSPELIIQFLRILQALWCPLIN